ncbi:hypothetical protein ACFO3J_35920, partial [Streptomyces polygonati]
SGRWHHVVVPAPRDPAPARYVCIGVERDLDHFLGEYGLTVSALQDKIATRVPVGVGGLPGPVEYLVHESVLRSDEEFPCAGDAEALQFCRAVADQLSTEFGITPGEAAARIVRHWCEPGDDGRTPRTWIVGSDIAYHEDPGFWAKHIYYGTHWWPPGDTPAPLPSP